MRFIVALLIASLFVDKADSELSFICIHALHISLEFAPSNIAIPTLSRQSHEPLIHSRSITPGEQVKIEKLTLGLGIIRLELMTSTTSR
jgi:hypothetical protein